MILLEIKNQRHIGGNIFIAERFFKIEDGLARLVAAHGALIEAPRGFFLAVDGVGNRAGDALLVRLVVKVFFQRRVGRVAVVGARVREFQFLRFAVERCFDFKFSQRAGAPERSARPVERQVGIGQQLQPERGDFFRVDLRAEFGVVFRRRVTAGVERAVRQRQVALPAS